MRISMPTIFNSIETQLAKLTEDMQKTNASIASGQKYQQVSDNPVDVGALMGLNGESNQVVQYQRNLDTGKDWLTSTEGTLTNINDLISATCALVNQMATGTYTAAQRAAAAQQVQQYMEEVMQMGNTRVNGKYILSGYKINTVPFSLQNFAIQAPVMSLETGSSGAASITAGATYTGTSSATYLVEIVAGGATGTATYKVSQDGGQTWTAPAPTVSGGPTAIGSQGVQADLSGTWVAGDRFTISVYQPITYQGDDNTLSLGIGQNSRLEVSQVGSEAVGGAGGANDIFQILATLKSNLEANDPATVGARLDDLKNFQAHLTSTIAGVGAALNRVDVKNSAYGSLNEQLTTSISDKGDTDMVEAVNDLKSKETAYQAALAASSKVMSMSLVDYLPT